MQMQAASLQICHQWRDYLPTISAGRFKDAGSTWPMTKIVAVPTERERQPCHHSRQMVKVNGHHIWHHASFWRLFWPSNDLGPCRRD